MLLPGCNMACRFCVTDSSVQCMTFEQASRLLAALNAQGIEEVVLGGGEPFLWPPGVVKLGALAKRLGFFVQIGTNAIALPPGFAHLDAVDRFVLPLESMDSAQHDAMRPFRAGSHHALTLDRLDTLRAVGRSVTVSTLVTAENIEALPDIGAFLLRYTASGALLHAWHLYKFIPEGRGGSRNADRFAISDTAYHVAADTARRLFPTLTIYKRPDMFHSRDVDFFWYADGSLCVGSQVWRAQIAG